MFPPHFLKKIFYEKQVIQSQHKVLLYYHLIAGVFI